MQKHLDYFQNKLTNRAKKGTLRSLQIAEDTIDFWSNDYLGFAQSKELSRAIEQLTTGWATGATGSRLISGNSALYEETEQTIAAIHKTESALLFNSGYDANIGLFSCLAGAEDVIFFDELVHASIHDGLRLSRGQTVAFKHNDMDDLAQKIEAFQGRYIYIATESVFSMDGDEAPLADLVRLAKKWDAALLIDEAHGLGVVGERGLGLVNKLNLERDIFARIHTFGKSLGVHGAAILGNATLRNYLMNYARSFIFTTAIPPHSVASIRMSYEYLQTKQSLVKQLQENIEYFLAQAKSIFRDRLLPSHSAIQGLLIPGNEAAKAVANSLVNAGFQVKAIVFPTVPKGTERIRICLHAFNTKEQIDGLLNELMKIEKMATFSVSI